MFARCKRNAQGSRTYVTNKLIRKFYLNQVAQTAIWYSYVMIGDQKRGATAQAIIDVRALRISLFPSEIFDEFAWNMLLNLFVGLAENEVISEKQLIERAGVSTDAGRRWILHLVGDGQVFDRSDGEDVILTPQAISHLRRFLDEAHAQGNRAVCTSK